MSRDMVVVMPRLVTLSRVPRETFDPKGTQLVCSEVFLISEVFLMSWTALAHCLVPAPTGCL